MVATQEVLKIMSDKIGVLITARPWEGTTDGWSGKIEFPSLKMVFPFQVRFGTPLAEISDFHKFADPIFLQNRMSLDIRNESDGGTWLSVKHLRFWKFHTGLTCHTLNGIAGSIANEAASPVWWEDDLPHQEFSIPEGIHYDMEPDQAVEDLLSSAMSAS